MNYLFNNCHMSASGGFRCNSCGRISSEYTKGRKCCSRVLSGFWLKKDSEKGSFRAGEATPPSHIMAVAEWRISNSNEKRKFERRAIEVDNGPSGRKNTKSLHVLKKSRENE